MYDEKQPMRHQRLSDPIVQPIPENEFEVKPENQPRVYEARHLIIEKTPKPPKLEKPTELPLKFPRYHENLPYSYPDPRVYKVGVFVPLENLQSQSYPTSTPGLYRPIVHSQMYEQQPQAPHFTYF